MQLIVKFTDQSPSFCNGVEFGRLLERMERNDESVKNNGFPVRIHCIFSKEVTDKVNEEVKGMIKAFDATYSINE